MNSKDLERAQAALRLAIARVGGVNSMAESVGLTPAAISQWLSRDGGVVPVGRVVEVERVSGVSRCDLRPDLWGTHE